MTHDTKDYEKKLLKLQLRMLTIQQRFAHEKRRGIIVFEGMDAAGKGGVIRRLTEKLDPRSCKVWPIAAPTPEEQGRHYLYRFWERLPAPGEIAIFDRSWYGRVLVERVEGFASDAAWKRAYREINEFEKMLTDDGARVIKIFLHISQEEQKKRFEKRINDPYKCWKLTEEDIRNRKKWPQYKKAIHEMLDKTNTDNAPWCVVDGDDKLRARLEVLKEVSDLLGKGVANTPPPVDPAVAKLVKKELGFKG